MKDWRSLAFHFGESRLIAVSRESRSLDSRRVSSFARSASNSARQLGSCAKFGLTARAGSYFSTDDSSAPTNARTLQTIILFLGTTHLAEIMRDRLTVFNFRNPMSDHWPT